MGFNSAFKVLKVLFVQFTQCPITKLACFTPVSENKITTERLTPNRYDYSALLLSRRNCRPSAALLQIPRHILLVPDGVPAKPGCREVKIIFPHGYSIKMYTHCVIIISPYNFYASQFLHMKRDSVYQTWGKFYTYLFFIILAVLLSSSLALCIVIYFQHVISVISRPGLLKDQTKHTIP